MGAGVVITVGDGVGMGVGVGIDWVKVQPAIRIKAKKIMLTDRGNALNDFMRC